MLKVARHPSLPGNRRPTMTVLAKLGVPVICSDLFGVHGQAWLDGLKLSQPYAGKVASLRQLAEELSAEIILLDAVLGDLLAPVEPARPAFRQSGGPRWPSRVPARRDEDYPLGLAGRESSAGLPSAPIRTRSRISMPALSPGASGCSSSTSGGPYRSASAVRTCPADSVMEAPAPASVTTARCPGSRPAVSQTRRCATPSRSTFPAKPHPERVVSDQFAERPQVRERGGCHSVQRNNSASLYYRNQVR